MSFFKKIGENIKTASRKVVSTIQEHQEAIVKERKRKNTYIKLKKQILKNLTLSDFKKICKEYGAGEPQKYDYNSITGEKTKKDETERNLYGEQIMYKVSLEQLIEFARRKKMHVSSIIKEKQDCDNEYNQESKIKQPDVIIDKNQDDTSDEFTQIETTIKKVNDLDLILQEIDNEFEFDKISSEKDLEDYLWMFLKYAFKGRHEIERQYRIINGTIDLVIDGKYGIEIKIAENNKVIQNLVGQVLKYVKHFGKNKVGVIILKTEKTDINELEDNIEHYESAGAKVLVLETHKGKLKRKPNNVKKFVLDTKIRR